MSSFAIFPPHTSSACRESMCSPTLLLLTLILHCCPNSNVWPEYQSQPQSRQIDYYDWVQSSIGIFDEASECWVLVQMECALIITHYKHIRNWNPIFKLDRILQFAWIPHVQTNQGRKFITAHNFSFFNRNFSNFNCDHFIWQLVMLVFKCLWFSHKLWHSTTHFQRIVIVL